MAFSEFAIVYLVFEIILYLFHLSVLILMIVQRKKNFKGPFFNIFRTVLVADLVVCLTVILSQKVSLIPSLNNFYITSTYFVNTVLNLLSLASGMQFMGHLFLALNRFTIIWLPLKHESIWRRQWYTVVIIGIAFLNIAWRLHQPSVYTFTADGSYSILFVNSYVAPINYTFTTIFYLSTTCLAGILNILTFLQFYLRKQNNSTLNVNEKNLLLVSMIIFISQILRCSYNFGRIVFGPNIMSIISLVLPYIIDIYAWCGSITLMFLSSSCRKAYRSFYLCKSKNAVTSSTNPTASKISKVTKMYPSTVKL